MPEQLIICSCGKWYVSKEQEEVSKHLDPKEHEMIFAIIAPKIEVQRAEAKEYMKVVS